MKPKQFLQTMLLLLTTLSTAQAQLVNGVFVANRNGSSVSLLEFNNPYSPDAAELLTTRQLRTVDEMEPMYISTMRIGHRGGIQDLIAVGDRKNNQVLFFDSRGEKLVHTTPLSKGAFHQYSHIADANRLLVATDIEKGLDIIEARFVNGQVGFEKRRFELPASLKTGRPHDVIAHNDIAFLSVLGVSPSEDIVLQINLNSLEIVKSRSFSHDVHLFNPRNSENFILVEEAGIVRLIDKITFQDKKVFQGPSGLHGVFADDQARFIFLTDINQGRGEDSVLVLENSKMGLKLVATADTPFATAHNLVALQSQGQFIITVTHSGAQQTALSVLEFDPSSKKLVFVDTVFTGLNPFGIHLKP